MANITLSIPEDLKKDMAKYKEANWSAIARRALEDYVKKLRLMDALLAKSELTEEDTIEWGRQIKKAVWKKHEKEFRKTANKEKR